MRLVHRIPSRLRIPLVEAPRVVTPVEAAEATGEDDSRRLDVTQVD